MGIDVSNQARVAIVGCGQIADAHIQEIAKISTARIVAVCDQHSDLARQAAERFAIPKIYTVVDNLLEQEHPDVVHITTPPQTHGPLAIQMLAGGAHVYVEKPFTLNLAEADKVLSFARSKKRLVCIGHDQLFDPAWLALQDRVKRGELGEIIHVDAILGYSITGPFGKVMIGDPGHWVHRLPGGLFQNNISHAVYKIADFMKDERPSVWATWFGQPNNPPTELRVMLRGERVTATIMFSGAIRPSLRVTRVYGTRACTEIDLDGRLLRFSRPNELPGAFGKVEMPLRHLAEAGSSFVRNLWRFLRSDLSYFTGMNLLFRKFYRAIANGGDSPTPASDIRRVTSIMDLIFECCRQECASLGKHSPCGQV